MDDHKNGSMAAFHVTCTWTTAIGADGAWLLSVKDLARRPGLQGLGYQYVARLGDLTGRVQAFLGRDICVDRLTLDLVVPPKIQAHLDIAHDAMTACEDDELPAAVLHHEEEEARRLLANLGLSDDEVDLVIRAARPPRTGRVPVAGSSRGE